MNTFSIREAFAEGWRGVSSHWSVFLVFVMAAFSVSNFFSFLFAKVGVVGLGAFLTIFLQLALLLSNTVIEFAGSALSLLAAKGETIGLPYFRNRTHLFLKFFGSFILYGLVFLPAMTLSYVVVMGTVLFRFLPYEEANAFVNGVPFGAVIYNTLLTSPVYYLSMVAVLTVVLLFFSMRLQFFRFFILDEEKGVSSLVRSFFLTKGENIRLFVFSLLVYFLISFSNFLPVFMAMFSIALPKVVLVFLIAVNFITVPISFVARANAYLQLKRKGLTQ